MDMLRLGLNYITDPFVTFFAGIMVLYILFLFIDTITQKVSGKHQENFDTRFGELFRQAKRPPAPKCERDVSTRVEVERMMVELEDSSRLYEDILGKQFKEKEHLNTQIAVLQEEKAGLTDRLEESQNQNASLKKQTADLNTGIEEMRKEHERAAEESKAQMESMEKEHERAADELTAKMESMGKEHERAAEKLQADLQAEMQAMEKKHSAFKADIEAKLELLGREKTAIEQKLEEVETERNSLLEQTAALKDELGKVRKEQKNESKKLQAQIEILTQEKTNLGSDLNAKLETLSTEKSGLAAELSSLQKKYAELEKDADHFQKQAGDVAAELELTGHSYGESAEKLEQQIMSMEVENASLKTELSKGIPKDEYDIVKEKYDVVNAQLTQYRNMCMELQSQLGLYRGEATIQDPSLIVQNDPVTKTLYEENKELSQKIEEYLDEISSLKYDLTELMSVREENEKLRKELGKGPAVPQKKPDIPKKDKERAQERRKEAKAKKQKTKKKKEDKKKKAGKTKKADETQEENLVKMQMSRDSVELVLSDQDLLEEIDAPATPKAPEVPHIVSKAAKKKEGDKKAKEKKPKIEKLFNVFLPKLTTYEKKSKAIPLIQEIAGISEEEAKQLAEKIVIPVAKGVVKKKADEIKQRFMEVGILPRVKEQV